MNHNQKDDQLPSLVQAPEQSLQTLAQKPAPSQPLDQSAVDLPEGDTMSDDPSSPKSDQLADGMEDGGAGNNGFDLEVKEQDRWLPIANVARIMKFALPDNAKIAKEAKECMQECVSEFISFITSEASEKCHQEKRKTVNGEDILFAMTSLGFENYSEALKIYLAKYREVCLETQASQGTRPDGMPQAPNQGFNAQLVAAAVSQHNVQQPGASVDTSAEQKLLDSQDYFPTN